MLDSCPKPKNNICHQFPYLRVSQSKLELGNRESLLCNVCEGFRECSGPLGTHFGTVPARQRTPNGLKSNSHIPSGQLTVFTVIFAIDPFAVTNGRTSTTKATESHLGRSIRRDRAWRRGTGCASHIHKATRGGDLGMQYCSVQNLPGLHGKFAPPRRRGGHKKKERGRRVRRTRR